MKCIKEVLEKVYTNDSLRKSVVPLFIGNPGLGKTVMIDDFAKEKGVNLVELITSQMSPFEISGIAMPDKESKKMTYFNFDKLENLKDGDILFFDELLNGNPIVLNACLTILEQRKFISGQPLPNIMIVAAANPQGMAPLTPQIKERFIWYDVKFSKSMWKKYMVNKYLITSSIGDKLINLITSELFTSNNFNTPRSIDKAVNMVINGVPTPYNVLIEPILKEVVKNPFEEEIDLGEGKKLAVGEMTTWLDIIRIKNKIPIKEKKVEPEVHETFKLPEHWYIRITLDNFDEINKFYDKLNTKWTKSEGYGLSDNGSHNYWKTRKEEISDNYKEITLKQFRKFVLKNKK